MLHRDMVALCLQHRVECCTANKLMTYGLHSTKHQPPPLGPLVHLIEQLCLPCGLCCIAVHLMCGVTCLAENLAWGPVVGLGICVRAVHGAHCGAEPEQVAS